MSNEHLLLLLEGLQVSITLTIFSLLIGGALAIILSVLLIQPKNIFQYIVRAGIFFFTGTPLLVQIYLIYYGPGQFDWVRNSIFWSALKEPWFCAVLALSLNTAAYTTLLIKGGFDSIPHGYKQACKALGLSRIHTSKILFSYTIRRIIPTYSNEVILVFKSTSLASTITIMDLMGYAQRINSQTYQTLLVFGIAGALYLTVNGVLTRLLRYAEHHALKFENPL